MYAVQTPINVRFCHVFCQTRPGQPLCRTLTPIQKDKSRAALNIACQYKAQEIRYAVAGLVVSLYFYTEDHYGFRDTVNIFLFLDIYLSAGSESNLVYRKWYTVHMTVGRSTLNTYSNKNSLLRRHKVVPIIIWGQL